MNKEYPRLPHRVVAMLLTAVIALSVVGFIRGILQGVPDLDEPDLLHRFHAVETHVAPPGVMPASSYSDMRRMETGPTSQWKYDLPQVRTVFDYQRCVTCHDPHTLTIEPDEQAKLESLKIRATRRAYNGAPPIVPHAVEQTDDAACVACHENGRRVGELVANRMPHRLLADCLQCHAPPPPRALAAHELAPPENLFAGLATPSSGPRAYSGAPPLVPHSTWMRQNCLSCHGGISGWPGLEVTHRWRANCLQCHGLSASLEQAVAGDPSFSREVNRP